MNEGIATNIRKGVLEYCVLALLAERDRYGLELSEALVSRGLSASEGSLYPLLARLREAGHVTSRVESPERGHSRRYYATTADGRRSLADFAETWRTIAPEVDALLEGVRP